MVYCYHLGHACVRVSEEEEERENRERQRGGSLPSPGNSFLPLNLIFLTIRLMGLLLCDACEHVAVL